MDCQHAVQKVLFLTPTAVVGLAWFDICKQNAAQLTIISQ